jgi:inner membrane protein YidH
MDTSTALAVDRTRLAYERTLMAWVRTAMSLISFGFTIYKFFQFDLAKVRPAHADYTIGPREFALLMIFTGLVALLLSFIQHTHAMRTIRATYGPQPRSVAGVIALFIGGLGAVAILAVIFQR